MLDSPDPDFSDRQVGVAHVVDAELPDLPRRVNVRTFDDVATIVGSAVGSFALVWLVYERLFALAGRLGFVLLWYVVFLALDVIVSRFANPGPVVVDRLMSAVVHGGTVVVGAVVAWAAGFVFLRGWPALHHVNFYTQDMSGVRPTSPLTQGGIKHALVGTAIQVGLAVAMALPLGLGTAIYLAEVGGRLATVVRTVVEAMTALPAVLAGLFVYAVLIIGLGWERDGFAVSVAMATTMIPVVARSSEVALRTVSGALREAGLALGASRWQTVRRVVLPTARSGLATSLIVGIARITGETAPLLIVSGASTFYNSNPFHNPMNSLPLFVFSGVRSGEPSYATRAYGAAAVLVVFVLALFVLTRILSRKRAGFR
ncbi:MAG: Phosphate transport system permease protein PstA [Ilumatobacteraceae bacterium]|nr:Phosphate transport system permease protein PstA [Ilumatobacteraceae bacterium]